MTRAEVSSRGFSVNGAPPGWGPFATETDPLRSAAREFLHGRSLRIDRVDRSAVAALLAVHLALDPKDDEPARTCELVVVVVVEGSECADRAFWRTARDRGGALASPADFAATLPSAVGGELAMAFGLRCPGIVFAGADSGDAATGLDSVAEALDPSGTAGVRLDVHLSGWSGASDGVAVATTRVITPTTRRGASGGIHHD